MLLENLNIHMQKDALGSLSYSTHKNKLEMIK